KNSGRVFGGYRILMEKGKDESSRVRNVFKLGEVERGEKTAQSSRLARSPRTPSAGGRPRGGSPTGPTPNETTTTFRKEPAMPLGENGVFTRSTLDYLAMERIEHLKSRATEMTGVPFSAGAVIRAALELLHEESES